MFRPKDPRSGRTVAQARRASKDSSAPRVAVLQELKVSLLMKIRRPRAADSVVDQTGPKAWPPTRSSADCINHRRRVSVSELFADFSPDHSLLPSITKTAFWQEAELPGLVPASLKVQTVWLRDNKPRSSVTGPGYLHGLTAVDVVPAGDTYHQKLLVNDRQPLTRPQALVEATAVAPTRDSRRRPGRSANTP